MQEATVLYSVTAVVITGLVVWTAVVLATVKTKWSRPPPAALAAASAVPLPPEATLDAAPTLNADSTSKATPAALASVREKVAEVAAEEAALAPHDSEAAKKAGS